MPDYGDILEFLASNPPQIAAERELHASLLELLAQCLRTDGGEAVEGPSARPRAPEESLADSHSRWVRFN